MKPVIFSIILLSFLLSIAAALKCYHCYKKDSDTCQQEVIECPEGEQCITTSEDYSYGRNFHSVKKGCSANKICGKTYGKTTNDVYIMVSTKCCNEDLCNSEMYEMPEDGEPSGPLCPACFRPNTTEECKAKGMLQCLKKEDKCLRFSGEVERPDGLLSSYSLKGCTSPQECKTDFSDMIALKMLPGYVLECDQPEPLSDDQK